MRVREILYPKRCIFCGRTLAKSAFGACDRCARALPYVTEPVCMQCGKPIADSESEYCFDCEQTAKRSPIVRGVAVWVYEGAVKQAVADFKYGGCASYAEYFAAELVRACGAFISSVEADVIVPAPIHRRRMWFRGYNQAGLLAEILGERAGIPVTEALRRKENTKALKTLSATERGKSLREAFAVCEDVSGRRILLVDDIYTTGATVRACAETLKEAGAAEIYAVYLCIGIDF